MFERYTDRARRVIFFARYEASALASSSIDTEHLLLGLLREGAGIAGKIFKRSKLTYEVARREIEARGRLQVPTSTAVDMPLSSQATASLQPASEEAGPMEEQHLDKEHLLLGLLEESEPLAAGNQTPKELRLEDVREEMRLR